MSLSNILVLSQATGYSLAFLMSFCVFVPLSLNYDNFQGHCLLYTSGTFATVDESAGIFMPSWSSPAYCTFSIFVGIFMLTVSVIQAIRMGIFLYYETDSSFFSAFLDTIICLLVTAFVFVTAIMVSGGFKAWCDAVTQRFSSCDYASLTQLFPQDTNIKTYGFYIEIGTAQFGAWCSWVCWVLLTVLAMRKLCRYHEEENIRVSMMRERKRLLNNASSNSQPSYEEIKS